MAFIYVFGVDVPLVEFLVGILLLAILFLGMGFLQLSILNINLKREITKLREVIDELKKKL